MWARRWRWTDRAKLMLRVTPIRMVSLALELRSRAREPADSTRSFLRSAAPYHPGKPRIRSIIFLTLVDREQTLAYRSLWIRCRVRALRAGPIRPGITSPPPAIPFKLAWAARPMPSLRVSIRREPGIPAHTLAAPVL